MKKNYPATVSIRPNDEIIEELDNIAEALFSKRSVILNECLRYGLEVFKEKRPDLYKIVEAYKAKKAQEEDIPSPARKRL